MVSHWRPAATQSMLRQRAFLYQQVRHFFADREVLEVETPVLAQAGVTDINIQCVPVPGYGYLQSSPEYHMKRLLAAGSGPIYQISRVFRDGEAGRFHNPEFSLLEWYRPGFSLTQLIDETVALIQCTHSALSSVAVNQVRFRQVFEQVTGLDPLRCDEAALVAQALAAGAPADLNRAQAVDFLMATVVEPAFPVNTLTVVTDFPPWAAALAQHGTDEQGDEVARRFEIYVGRRDGTVELANGYQELVDATEQAHRFSQDQQQRRALGRPEMAIDSALLAALQHGLPACAGVALGLDRLLMCISGAESVEQVLAFPIDRA